MRNIIVYGGTFDPIHNGHIKIIEHVKGIYNDSLMLVVPNNSPPHKKKFDITNFKHRVNMINLAISDINDVEVSLIESGDFTHYTIDTLKKIKDDFNNDNISLLIGSDMFLDIEKWHKYKDILKEYELIVFLRFLDDYKKIIEETKKLSLKKLTVIDDIILKESSTKIRKDKRVRAKMLKDNVLFYIKENNLYE